MAEPRSKWHQSPAVMGVIITVGGFGLVTLGYWLLSLWMVR